MSVHVAPSFADDALGAGPAEAVAAGVVNPRNSSAFVAGWSGRIPAARLEQPTDDVLWVRLRHMGVAIALPADPVAPTEATPSPDPADAAHKTIHFLLNAAAVGTDCEATDARPSTGEDPVIIRLSSALQAAERSDDRFAGLYADALRLAVVTRLVSLREQTVRAPAAALDPAPRSRRPASGLVKWRLKRVMDFVDAQLHRPITLAEMAGAAGLSRMHFAAQFRLATGLRAHEYLLKRRIECAQTLLLETREPLAQIALSVGFQTQAHFTTVFRRFVGDTPYQWRCARTAC